MFKVPAAKYWSRDMPVDPNEPIYCNCRRVAYGEMICCDNNEVSFPNQIACFIIRQDNFYFSVSPNGSILDVLD